MGGISGLNSARSSHNVNERLWADKWCAGCHGLRAHARDKQGNWRCLCGQLAPLGVSRELSRDEAGRSLFTPQYWADECNDLHGGTCLKRWDHEMRKRDQ